MDAVQATSKMMNKDNHSVLLTQTVPQFIVEVKLHEKFIHRELGMILKSLEPGHQHVRLGGGVVRARPG